MTFSDNTAHLYFEKTAISCQNYLRCSNFLESVPIFPGGKKPGGKNSIILQSREIECNVEACIEMNKNECSILGVKVHAISFEETIATIQKYIEGREPRMVITLGTEMVMAAQKNSEFISIVNGCDLVCADAVGIAWALKRKGFPIEEKVAGIDILEKLCSMSGPKGWKLYFLGSGEGVAEEAVQNLRKRYPEMIVAGISHGFFTDDDIMVEKIRASSPDILFIAMGSPKQEFWFWKHREKLGVPVGIGVGGSLDVLSGKLRRSPRWMIRFGLEWLYRLYLQPWRWKRMLVLPLFVLNVLMRDRKKRQN